MQTMLHSQIEYNNNKGVNQEFVENENIFKSDVLINKIQSHSQLDLILEQADDDEDTIFNQKI